MNFDQETYLSTDSYRVELDALISKAQEHLKQIAQGTFKPGDEMPLHRILPHAAAIEVSLETYYVHFNGASWFVKTADYFVSQNDGGAWRRAWVPILAESIDDARDKALRLFGKVDPTAHIRDSEPRVLQDWMRVLVFADLKERLALPNGDEGRVGADALLDELYEIDQAAMLKDAGARVRGGEYLHAKYGRVLVIGNHPHDGAARICETVIDDESLYFLCDRSSLSPLQDQGQWPNLGWPDGGEAATLAQPREKRFDVEVTKYEPNTIYHIATDSEGKPVEYGTRSTNTPSQDMTVLYAALEFEQAKRLRGVEIQPHKVGELWMTTIEPIQISHDFYSHRQAWRAAILRQIDTAPPATVDSDDRAYWERELKAFDRTFDTLPVNSSHALRLYIPETVRDRLIAETIIAAHKIVNDAELLQQLRDLFDYDDASVMITRFPKPSPQRPDWNLKVMGRISVNRNYAAASMHQAIAVAHKGERDLLMPEPEGVKARNPDTVTFERMQALLIEVKDEFGVESAKAIMRDVGGMAVGGKMADIVAEKYQAVIEAAQEKLKEPKK